MRLFKFYLLFFNFLKWRIRKLHIIIQTKTKYWFIILPIILLVNFKLNCWTCEKKLLYIDQHPAVHTWSSWTVQKDSSVESEDKESECTLVRRDCMSSYTPTCTRPCKTQEGETSVRLSCRP